MISAAAAAAICHFEGLAPTTVGFVVVVVATAAAEATAITVMFNQLLHVEGEHFRRAAAAAAFAASILE